jgi:putative transposase
MAIKKDVLDELLAGADGEDVFGKNGLFDELKKALSERMLNAEMNHHLTQEAAEPGRNQANHRNGYSKKTSLTDATKIEIAVPRGRAGTSDPQLTAKYQRRFPGFGSRPSARARTSSATRPRKVNSRSLIRCTRKA